MSSSSNATAELRTWPVPPIALSLEEWEIVSAILRRHLPGREVWAYGSRARGTRLKKYSDLDLAIEGPPLSLSTLSALAEAFDESSLAFKVDIVDAASLEPEFRHRIEADKVVLSSSR
jgi:predicted nucleotidyltransferase